MKLNKGFTLIELLVAISILAILSTVGLVSFQSVRNRALDAKVKADLDSIKKAYEQNFDPSLNGGQGGYKPITSSSFASGKIPIPDGGGTYVVVGPDTSAIQNNSTADGSGANFAACVNLSDGSRCASPVTNVCYCVSSTGGTTLTPDTQSSCDAYGILKTGLVGWWKFDEGTGSTIGDFTTNGLNGSLGSGPTWVTNTSECKGGNCVRYANAGYSSVPYNSKLNITSNVTYNIWTKITAPNSSTWPEIMTRNTHLSFGLRQNKSTYSNSGYFEWGYNLCNQQSGNYTSKTITNNITDSNWHMLTMTQNGSSIKVYLDGTLVGSPTTLSSFCSDTSTGLRFGIALTGYLDDARVYNRALSDNEVSLLYNKGNGCF